MAKVFLDTNTFIDAIHRNPEAKVLDQLEDNIPFMSPLSVHIYCYSYKIKAPNQILSDQLKKFSLVDLTESILLKTLDGPTSDLEDNIQLHSAAEAECDYFLTNDDKLLKMKFFGKTKIVSSLTG
ncbi:MAG: hypothetical protein UU93_C0005G0019 [Candidatus Amesbacteria bacterium GW2011_GWA2_42_12]|uniref:PIN domain-containing protein n=1 Tax=Candidatus Amesbacteria bacterium GW2011_GWA2_42_12 TaxID=1618356 RepID=A0A0G1AF08_9BACT|nr:MAG: hypothetical protein UU93_C0005G0019 [Candidatus Amesbacteria bacterium GW2011_GWA2_42_12]